MKKRKRKLLKKIFSNSDLKYFFIIGSIITILIITSSSLIYWIERSIHSSNSINNIFDAVWWAIVTITTVGYGDMVPNTPSGRVVGIFLIFFGFTLFSLFTGLIASMMIDSKLRGVKGLKKIKESNHIIIAGWNKTGYIMLKTLAEKQQLTDKFIITGEYSEDFFSDLLAKFPELSLKFVRGDITQHQTFRRANLSQAKQAIILTEVDQTTKAKNYDDRTIIVANTIRYLSKKVPITVQLFDENNKVHLENININNIISFNEIGGYMLANNTIDNHYIKFFDSVLRNSKNILEICDIPPNFIGLSYSELFDFFSDKNKLLIGIISKKTVLEVNDIFSGDKSAIDDFIKSALEKSKKNYRKNPDQVQINPDNNYIIKKNDIGVVLN